MLSVVFVPFILDSQYPVTPDVKAETLPRNSGWPGSRCGVFALEEGGEN